MTAGSRMHRLGSLLLLFLCCLLFTPDQAYKQTCSAAAATEPTLYVDDEYYIFPAARSKFSTFIGTPHVHDKAVRCCFFLFCYYYYFISLLFNQVGQLRASSHLQLPPGQDKAKQCDKNNNTELHINKRTVNDTIEKYMYSV